MANLERESRVIIETYVSRRLVFLVPGGPRDNPDWVSSGTVFSTPRGHVAVLTARHCARDAEHREIRIGFHGCVQAMQNSVAAVMYHPDSRLDVALLVLKRQAREALRDVALGPTDIADDDIVPATDALYLGGFPATWVMSPRPREWGMVSVTYGTALADVPRDVEGRYRVLWTERETTNGNVEMPEPEGISGGALWRFRGGVSTVWSPTNRIRIAGIPSAWRPADRVEIVEPSPKWKAWVVEAFESVDRTVPMD